MNNNLKYQLIISDFDETLGDCNRRVSKLGQKIIADYQAQGGFFTLATGRNLEAASSVAADMGLSPDIPLIACQGAVIADSNGKIYFEARLNSDIVTAVVADLEELGLYIQLYNDDVCLRNRDSEYTEPYERATGLTVTRANLAQYLKTVSSVQKIIVMSSEDTVQRTIKLLAPRYPMLSFNTTGTALLEIYSKDAGKGNAVKFLTESLLHLSPAQLMTFGDSPNDISMLEYAGCGVAMRNAQRCVQQAADQITEFDHNNDGVPLHIKKVCGL